MVQTLKRERRQKFTKIISTWIADSPAITDVIGEDTVLEEEIEKLAVLLADAATSESERRTDETFGEYKTSSIYKIYQENIGLITPIIAEQLKEIEDAYPDGWFEDAVKEALKANVRKLNYVVSILERWKANGKNHGKPSESVKRVEGQSSGYYG